MKRTISNWLRYIIGSLLLAMSLWFILNPDSVANFQKFHQPDFVRLILGWIEAIVSLLFIINRTKVIGGLGLLSVFAFAAYLHFNDDLTPYGLIPWSIGIILLLRLDYHQQRSQQA